MTSLSQDSRLSPFCNTPAQRWEDAFVSGNGLTGLMQWGEAGKDRLTFTSHHFLLPNGTPIELPDMSDQLAPLRQGMIEGHIQKSWKTYWDTWEKRSGHEGFYWTQEFHPGYELHFESRDIQNSENYHRQCDYLSGEVRSLWSDQFGKQTRSSFASRHSQLLFTKVTSEKPRDFDLTVQACPQTPTDIHVSKITSQDSIAFQAIYPEVSHGQGAYEGRSRVVLLDGNLTATEDQLSIKKTTSFIIITKLARYRNDSDLLATSPLLTDLQAFSSSYEAELEAHRHIHEPIFKRVEFSLGVDEQERQISNNDLLRTINQKEQELSPRFLESLFYTSRYLFLSSCGSDYGPRLSGLFIGEWGAAWAGDYTCDANVNFAVTGGNLLDLPEAMEGYFQIIERTIPQWREAAQKLHGCRGIFGPIRIDGENAIHYHSDYYYSHMVLTGLGPWLFYPMWEYYQVSGNKKFLEQRLYPLLVEQALFYEDFLQVKDEKGHFIFAPSNSPENFPKEFDGPEKTSTCINATVDIAACKHGLRMALEAHTALGKPSDPQTQKWEEMIGLLPPYLLTEDGALKEWSWKEHQENYDHRHASHTYPAWPAGETDPDHPKTAWQCEAFSKALAKREYPIIAAHDALQKVYTFIRIKNRQGVEGILKHMLSAGYFFDSLATSHNVDLDIYNYDFILSYQGLMAEAAYFSEKEKLELLPAMPDSLPVGTLSGAKARNQCDLHQLTWDRTQKKISLDLTSRISQKIELIHRDGIKKVETSAELITTDHSDRVSLQLKAGERTQVTILW